MIFHFQWDLQRRASGNIEGVRKLSALSWCREAYSGDHAAQNSFRGLALYQRGAAEAFVPLVQSCAALRQTQDASGYLGCR
jgi:hypothetical protein